MAEIHIRSQLKETKEGTGWRGGRRSPLTDLHMEISLAGVYDVFSCDRFAAFKVRGKADEW